MADEIRIGSRTLQPNRQLLASGEHVHLGARALQILTVLAEANGEIVTKDELFEAVWPDQVVEENALQAHIAAIRKALGDDAMRLETLRGVGYRLVLENPNAFAASPESTLQPIGHTPEELVQVRQDRKLSKLVVATILGGLLATVFGLYWAFGSPASRPSGNAPILLAVLPFESASDTSDSILANGITDELIVRLRRFPELRIASGELPAAQASESYKIEGTVRQVGNDLRVSARLLDPVGQIVWSDNFDRELVDLLYVQEEIAAAVSSALSVPLQVGLETSDMGGTENSEAYANYVQARAQREAGDFSRAIQYGERAVELDPEYARAWAELAYTNGVSINDAPDAATVTHFREKADIASNNAIAAAPDSWVGYAARAWYYLSEIDIRSADLAMQQAIARDPGNDADLRDNMATFSGQLGRVEEAISYRQSMALIDPLFESMVTPGQNNELFLAGRYREVIDLHQRALRQGQELSLGDLAVVAGSYFMLGEMENAQQITGSSRWQDLAAIEFPRMPPDDLRAWADRRYGAGGRSELLFFASRAGYLDEDVLALEYLEIAYERPALALFHFLWHPLLSDVRQTDGFEQLVTDLGFVEAWRESGEWGDFCRPVSDTEIACE